MAWSIAEVARMSGTTSRTLRHYHDIGLLEPAFVGDNGYRYYEREQLLRLQQILLLRELDIGLPVIARVLAGQQDTVTAVEGHLRRLRAERARLRHLQRTVERTLHQLKGEDTMPVEHYFEGFDRKQQEAYERELVERFSDDARRHIDESVERTKSWTQDDWATAMDDFGALLGRLAALKRQGVPAGADATQALVADHHGWLARFWTADREAYAGIAELYAHDDRFRVHIDDVEPGLASYLRDAMQVYAEQRLS